MCGPGAARERDREAKSREKSPIRAALGLAAHFATTIASCRRRAAPVPRTTGRRRSDRRSTYGVTRQRADHGERSHDPRSDQADDRTKARAKLGSEPPIAPWPGVWIDEAVHELGPTGASHW